MEPGKYRDRVIVTSRGSGEDCAAAFVYFMGGLTMRKVSEVVKATVGAAERRADIQHEWHIARKTTTNRASF